MKPKFQSALISVSDACRVACRHCFRADKGGSDLSLEVLERALSRLREIGVEQVCLTGGEPLDHPALDRIIRKSIQFGLRVSLITGRAERLSGDPLPEWLQRVDTIGLSFDSNSLVAAGVSARRIEAAVAAARNLRAGPRAYLHGTCFNLSLAEVRFMREVRSKYDLEVTVSPAVIDERLRDRLGFTAERYSAQLASDLRCIEDVLGVTERLSSKFFLLASNHRRESAELCRSTRLYVSAAGYMRICPYDRAGEISVFEPRSQIHQALESAINQPAKVSLGCIGTCGSLQ